MLAMKTVSGNFGAICLLAMALCTPVAAADYKLGERLPSASAKPQDAAKGRVALRELRWEELVPADWDPRSIFKDIDLGMLNDADPRAMAALDKLREVWNNAPANPALNGTRIRIPGFIVPLEHRRDEVTEFLLVPYFGACIHSPPPPSNQIIHVIPATPLKNAKTMDAVWVNGTLEVGAKSTDMGNAAYRIKPERIEPYKRPEPKR
jgi:hypothetical protein